MDMNKVAGYRNKISAIEKRNQKIKEEKITLKAQIDQSIELRDEKKKELKEQFGVDYADSAKYIADKEKEINDIENEIEAILNGKETAATERVTENTISNNDEEVIKQKTESDDDLFGVDIPF